MLYSLGICIGSRADTVNRQILCPEHHGHHQKRIDTLALFHLESNSLSKLSTAPTQQPLMDGLRIGSPCIGWKRFSSYAILTLRQTAQLVRQLTGAQASQVRIKLLPAVVSG